MLASRTTLPHLAISSLMRSPNSSGVLATGAKPSPSSRCLTSGVATALAISLRQRSMMSFGVPAGATMPVSVSLSRSPNAGLGVGRNVRQGRRALAAEHGEPAQLALADVAHGRRQRRERDRRVAADGRVDRQGGAVERHGDEVETVLLLEQLAGEMRRRAGRWLREAVFAGIGLHQIDELLERLAGKPGCAETTLGEAATRVIGEKSLTGS